MKTITASFELPDHITAAIAEDAAALGIGFDKALGEFLVCLFGVYSLRAGKRFSLVVPHSEAERYVRKYAAKLECPVSHAASGSIGQ